MSTTAAHTLRRGDWVSTRYGIDGEIVTLVVDEALVRLDDRSHEWFPIVDLTPMRRDVRTIAHRGEGVTLYWSTTLGWVTIPDDDEAAA